MPRLGVPVVDLARGTRRDLLPAGRQGVLLPLRSWLRHRGGAVAEVDKVDVAHALGLDPDPVRRQRREMRKLGLVLHPVLDRVVLLFASVLCVCLAVGLGRLPGRLLALRLGALCCRRRFGALGRRRSPLSFSGGLGRPLGPGLCGGGLAFCRLWLRCRHLGLGLGLAGVQSRQLRPGCLRHRARLADAAHGEEPVLQRGRRGLALRGDDCDLGLKRLCAGLRDRGWDGQGGRRHRQRPEPDDWPSLRRCCPPAALAAAGAALGLRRGLPGKVLAGRLLTGSRNHPLLGPLVLSSSRSPLVGVHHLGSCGVPLVLLLSLCRSGGIELFLVLLLLLQHLQLLLEVLGGDLPRLRLFLACFVLRVAELLEVHREERDCLGRDGLGTRADKDPAVAILKHFQADFDVRLLLPLDLPALLRLDVLDHVGHHLEGLRDVLAPDELSHVLGEHALCCLHIWRVVGAYQDPARCPRYELLDLQQNLGLLLPSGLPVLSADNGLHNLRRDLHDGL
mmetsp:Transcript_20439/g.55767  ORF Transcript_20439/g.55767 Transcript_20439/m.55767 type:complete len:507 (+) Transcript_20439:177-1697(+)